MSADSRKFDDPVEFNAFIRDRIDHVVRTESGAHRCYHVPHAESSEDTPKPLCCTVSMTMYHTDSDFIAKSLAIYPPAHTEGKWCDNCIEKIKEDHPAWLRFRSKPGRRGGRR